MKGNVEFKKLWDTIKDLKYGHNDFKGVVHEDHMIDLLNESGMIDVSKIRPYKKHEFNILKKYKMPGDNITHLGFENGTYIYQPFGTRGAPDFVCFVNNTYVMIELKAGKGEVIQWNTHVPQKNWIYIFTWRKSNHTTYFLGQEIIPDKMRLDFEKIEKLNTENRKEMKAKYLNMVGNKTKFHNYNRPMYVSDEKMINNAFREEREERVDEFVNDILNA